MAGATHLDTNISFDPRVISYDDLLKVLLTVRNPTTRNKQGPDEGPQYRSIIFHRTPEQKTAALAAIRKMTAARTWKAPIVTEVKPFKSFYVAEDYHLDYYSCTRTRRIAGSSSRQRSSNFAPSSPAC